MKAVGSENCPRCSPLRPLEMCRSAVPATHDAVLVEPAAGSAIQGRPSGIEVPKILCHDVESDAVEELLLEHGAVTS